MTKPLKYHVTLTITLSLLLLLSGCASNIVRDWPPAEGVVLDADTGEPIAGVVVEARWEGNAGYTTTMCFHVENTYTDENGHFSFPPWHNDEASFYKKPRQYFAFHKAGYRLSKRNYRIKTYMDSSYHEGIYYLEKDPRSNNERLHDLRSQYLYLCNYDKSNQWLKFRSVFLELQSMGLRPNWIGEIITQRLWNMDLEGEAAYNYVEQRIMEDSQ